MDWIKSIAIDVGHGGKDPGSVADVYADGAARLANRGRLLEKDLNLRLGAEVFGQALEAGFEAHLLRGGDYDQSLGQRTELANRLGVDFFLSIHHNGAASAAAGGTETFYFPGSQGGELAAGLVQAAMVGELGLADRGIKANGNLHVLRGTRMPAILIEPLFLTGEVDQGLLSDGGYFRRLAEAVVGGLGGRN